MDLDRVAGALVGLAAGDALGAGYEFTQPRADEVIEMRGGGIGPFAPGEWTDDTAQAVAIAEVAATGQLDLDAVGQGFLDWYADGPKDVGISTAAVLGRAARTTNPGPAERLRAAAADYWSAHPRGSAGNGSLMRTAAVALAHLGDDRAIASAAVEVSALTHGDPLAAEACVLWCIAIDRAVTEGRLDGAWDGLALLPNDRAAFWRDRLTEAERDEPGRFTPNGFVVTALQAAHAAVTQTPVPDDQPCRHLQHALESAVRIGHDTDTVAAIAGQVLGAKWGASAVPWRWRRLLHGWPEHRYADLVRLAVMTAQRGVAAGGGWPIATSMLAWGRKQEPTPRCVASPDDGLLVGNLPGLMLALQHGVDAVVSLCRMGATDVPADVEHVQVWLADQPSPANPNLAFVLADAADAVTSLRAEGKRVYLHCVGGRSRTPTVAALHLAATTGRSPREALQDVAACLPEAHPNSTFLALLDRLDSAHRPRRASTGALVLEARRAC